MRFKDEMTYTDAPQPYGEIFVMRADGSAVEQLTRQSVGGRHAGLAADREGAGFEVVTHTKTERLGRTGHLMAS